MSHIKDEIDANDAQRSVALEILVEAGVLHQCPAHSDMYYNAGGDVENAYRKGNARFTEQQNNHDYAMELFETRREMTDAIKAAYEEFGAWDECPMGADD